MTEPLAPLLRWMGGKFNQRLIIEKLSHLWDSSGSDVWVEPFAGGLGATHRINPERAMLADLNPELIKFYQWVKYGGSWDNPTEAELDYYELRDLFNAERTPERLYYLNRRCFNGLYRVNSKGGFNTPIGRDSAGNPLKVPLVDLAPYRELYQGWSFNNWSWQKTLEMAPPESFIYADPPYDGTADGYNADGFTWEQQKSLIKELAMHPGPVTFSNAGTDRIIAELDLYGFEYVKIKARRSVNCDGKGRQPVDEILAYRL